MNAKTCKLFVRGYRSKLKSNQLARRHTHDASAVELYDVERDRQLSSHRRVQKVTVSLKEVHGVQDIKLHMNKHTSTPYSCAKHISEYLKTHSCLSLVNGVPWSMHKPLVDDCDLTLLNFQQDDPTIINQAYWRSCAFILGSILKRAVKPECNLLLHRPPHFLVESGSFAYDFSGDFGREDWKPTSRELLVLSQMANKLSQGIKGKSNYFFICPLDVSLHIAQQMFHDNRHKLKLVEELANRDGNEPSITVYKMGNHVDVLGFTEPLVSNADAIGRFNVTAVHKIGEEGDRAIYRAQGVSLPSTLTAHSWTYDHLIKNATPLNTSEEIQPDPVVSETERNASMSV